MRQIKIATVNADMFEGLLSGETRCVNWPYGARVKRIQFAAETDDWRIQVASESFDEIPVGERFPDLMLAFTRYK